MVHRAEHDAVDPAVDYSTEPMTLVDYWLDETPEATTLTMAESRASIAFPTRSARISSDSD